MNRCHTDKSCDKPVCRFFLWPLFANGSGETIGGEYCRKHGKKFMSNCKEDDQVREVSKLEFAIWQVMES